MLSNLQVLNLASGLSSLLVVASFYVLVAVNLPIGVYFLEYLGITLTLFLAFRQTSIYRFVKPNLMVTILFAIGNLFTVGILFIGLNLIRLLPKNADGSDVFGVAIFIGSLYLLGIALLLFGLVVLLFQINKRKSDDFD